MSMTTVAEAPATDTSFPELRIADRCDTGNCGAQAFYRFVYQSEDGGQDLLMCKHHGDKTSPVVAGRTGWTVVDETSKINREASVSANAV